MFALQRRHLAKQIATCSASECIQRQYTVLHARRNTQYKNISPQRAITQNNIIKEKRELYKCPCARESSSPVAQRHLVSESQFSGEASRHRLTFSVSGNTTIINSTNRCKILVENISFFSSDVTVTPLLSIKAGTGSLTNF